MLDPKRCGTYRVSLILFLFITDPHGQVVDQVRDGRQLPDLGIQRVKVLLDKLANIGKPSAKLLRVIILPNLAQLVNPVGQPDRLVIMNNLLPSPRWDWRILREIQDNILRKYSRLPPAPHRMTSTPHEYAGRFYHVVCKLSLRPIDNSVAILLLQLKANLLPRSRHTLLQFL